LDPDLRPSGEDVGRGSGTELANVWGLIVCHMGKESFFWCPAVTSGYQRLPTVTKSDRERIFEFRFLIFDLRKNEQEETEETEKDEREPRMNADRHGCREIRRHKDGKNMKWQKHRFR